MKIRVIIYKTLIFFFDPRKNEKNRVLRNKRVHLIIYQKAYSLNITDGPFCQPEAL